VEGEERKEPRAFSISIKNQAQQPIHSYQQ